LKHMMVCISLIAGHAADVAHAQFGVPWRHTPSITAISLAAARLTDRLRFSPGAASDERFALAQRRRHAIPVIAGEIRAFGKLLLENSVNARRLVLGAGLAVPVAARHAPCRGEIAESVAFYLAKPLSSALR
jgi:hypothetical protein